ncbi:MAG: helix-turn-helix transcriptional regulator [Clostridiales bacterium]|nr:helix-turn-helix transcriptional regulator [Clostridiales bacterium]
MTNSKVNKELVTRQQLGWRIYQAIERTGWPREEVAARLNVSLRTINYWQSGIKLPGLPKIVELAKLLNVSLDSLLLN